MIAEQLSADSRIGYNGGRKARHKAVILPGRETDNMTVLREGFEEAQGAETRAAGTSLHHSHHERPIHLQTRHPLAQQGRSSGAHFRCNAAASGPKSKGKGATRKGSPRFCKSIHLCAQSDAL